MKYLICAFRRGILINTARGTMEGMETFIQTTSQITGLQPESLTIVKYDLSKYERLELCEQMILRVTQDKITLHQTRDGQDEIYATLLPEG